MILSKMKLYGLVISLLLLLATGGYIYYQSYKLNQADINITNLQSKLAEANAAFTTQKQSYERIKNELDVSHKTIEQLNKSVVETTKEYIQIKKEIELLRNTDHEVDTYLNIPIPDSLFDRLYQRSN